MTRRVERERWGGAGIEVQCRAGVVCPSAGVTAVAATLRDTSGMASTTLVPVSEYLSTVYEPDCDYVDGELEERNLGERSHSSLQFILAAIFNANRKAWNVIAVPEVRVQVAPERFRVPDVTVMRRSDPAAEIVQTAPLVCIEVLSPEDRIGRMQERFADYFRMGVEHVWMFDPATRNAWTALADGSLQHVGEALAVPGTAICVKLADVWAELDDMLRQE